MKIEECNINIICLSDNYKNLYMISTVNIGQVIIFTDDNVDVNPCLHLTYLVIFIKKSLKIY